MPPKTRSSTKKEQEKPTTSTPNPSVVPSKPTQKAARVTPAGRKAPSKKRKQAIPSTSEPATKKQDTVPKRKNKWIVRMPPRGTGRAGPKRQTDSTTDDSLELSEVSSEEYDYFPRSRDDVPVNFKFPLLNLPLLAATNIFEQLRIQEQVFLSFFRRSRKLLQQIPQRSFKTLNHAVSWGEDVYLKRSEVRIHLTFEQAENLTKHRVKSKCFEWSYTKENEKAFWNILSLYDKRLPQLQLSGEVDQRFYNSLVESPRWKMLKRFTQEASFEYKRYDISIRASDFFHFRDFHIEIEKMNDDETWQEILKNFFKTKSTFRVRTKEALQYDKIKDWLKDNTIRGDMIEISKVSCRFIEAYKLPNDPKLVLVFGMSNYDLCGAVCDKKHVEGQFTDFWNGRDL